MDKGIAPSGEWKKGDRVVYADSILGETIRLRGVIVGPDEGWWKVRFSDDSTASVKPSKLIREAAN